MKTTLVRCSLALAALVGLTAPALAVPGGSYRGIDGKSHSYNGIKSTGYGPGGSSSSSSSAATSSSSQGWQYKQTLNGTPMRYQFTPGGSYRSEVLQNGKWTQ